MSVAGRVIVVGGVPGVGKTTLCRALANELGASYVSASSLIPNRSPATFMRDQWLIATNIDRLRNKRDLVLLDGHFCLEINSMRRTVALPIFRRIQPLAILLVVGVPSTIATHLAQRDGSSPSPESIASLQTCELARAQIVAAALSIPFQTVVTGQRAEATDFILVTLKNER